jgi:hypothetical protein
MVWPDWLLALPLTSPLARAITIGTGVVVLLALLWRRRGSAWGRWLLTNLLAKIVGIWAGAALVWALENHTRVTPAGTSHRDASAGVLFAGDHVLPHITPSIGFEPIRTTSPLRDYLASLALMREMPDILLLPAHGPATISVHERVDQLLHHHAQRLDLTLEAVSRGASTADDVAHQLVWTSRGTRFSDMNPFNSMLAVLETAAHLEVLVERDLVKVTDIDGVRHYTT